MADIKKKKRARKNVYTHPIDLVSLYIKNAPKESFRAELEKIPYKGYEVESISDGRKIIVTKPGGKFTFGTIKRDDFMVWIYNPKDGGMWLISHANIIDDLEDKGEVDPAATVAIIDALERVYEGEEPDGVLKSSSLRDDLPGEAPEVIMKAYKWIWGQEDVNYPSGKGRAMSWEGIKKNEDGVWEKTGKGIENVRIKLKS